MNRFYKLLLGFILVIFVALPARGSHMMGSDISYICISPGKYKIIAKVYRDCRGIPLNSPTIRAFCGDNGVSGVIGLNYTRIGIYDITPTCAAGTAPCNPQNQTVGSEGIEEHVYEAIVDFNSSPYNSFVQNNCCKVFFSVDQCCRNGAITTLNPGVLYSECMLDLCNIRATTNKCNTSPQLSIVPVAYICCNQPFIFNNGAKEVVDGDSLAYKLANPLSNSGTNENYSGNYTPTIPMTPYCPPNPGTLNCKPVPNAKPPRGFYFDKETGDIIFTPTDCEQVGVIVIQIDEYRKDSADRSKWLLIGQTRRDMQLVVKKCADNNPPQIIGTNKHAVCEGGKICFTISTKDELYSPNQTVPDTVQLTWNQGIPGATFTIIDPTAREKQAEFCWQTNIGDARPNPYSFTATAKDDNCTNPSSSNKGFNVIVNPKALSTRVFTIGDCGWLKFNSIPTDTVNYKKENYRYEWQIRDSTNSGIPLKGSVKKLDSFKFQYGGKYIFTHIINNPPYNCPSIYLDTVIMPPLLDIQLSFGKDTFVCEGNSFTASPMVANGKQPYKFQWESPLGTKNPKDTLQTFTITPIATTKIAVSLRDVTKCIDYDTITVLWVRNPRVDIGPDLRICSYNEVTLDAQHNDTMRYYWQPFGDSTRTLTTSIKGKYTAKVINNWGCFGTDQMELFVNDTVVAIAGPDRGICVFDTLKVVAKRRPVGYSRLIEWKNLGTGLIEAYDSAFSRKITSVQDNSYELYLKVTQAGLTCENRDTFNLHVHALPPIPKVTVQARCYDEGRILLNYTLPPSIAGQKLKFSDPKGWITGGPYPSSVYIDFPKFMTNAQVPKTGYNGLWAYNYRDSNNCYNERLDNSFRIFPNPEVELKNGIFCQKLGRVDLTTLIQKPFNRVGGIEEWNALEVPDGSGLDPETLVYSEPSGVAGLPDKWYIPTGAEGDNSKTGDYKIRYCYKEVLSGCQRCDTAIVNIIRLPEIQFKQIPDQCVNYPILELDSFVLEKTTGKYLPDGLWSVVEFGYSRDRSNSSVDYALNNGVKNGKQFDPSTAAGDFMLKFEHTATGCAVSDSTMVRVNGLPRIDIFKPDTICSSAAPVTLSVRVNGVNYFLNADGKWSGTGVTLDKFDPSISAKTQQYEGPVKVVFRYKHPVTGCESADSSYKTIQSQPEVSISSPKPFIQCEGPPFALSATKAWAAATTWVHNGDGTLSDIKSLSPTYAHGLTADTATGQVLMSISTDPEGVCPVATDNITLIIQPYPQIRLTADPLQACEPSLVSFESMVYKPYGSPNLKYLWEFGDGKTSIEANPQNLYESAKQEGYSVRLTVSNQWGADQSMSCVTTIDSISYIQVHPMPKAAFESDPEFFSTVAFPRFQFFNRSTLQYGTMSYLWNFGTDMPEDSGSIEKDPVFTYPADTMSYWVNLTVESDKGCIDSIGQPREIRPDVTVFVPNAFSPEKTGPGMNNLFTAIVNGEKTFEIKVFNRWGEKMWETKNKLEGWDGKYLGNPCQQDVYMWVVKVTSFENQEYEYSGTISLLR